MFSERTVRVLRGLLPIIVAALIPVFVTQGYVLTVFITLGIYILMAVGLCCLFGYGGQFSLAAGAFCGIGAYSTAFLTTKVGVPVWIGLAASAIFPGIVAYLIGYPIMKLRGYILAIATIAVQTIFEVLIIELESVTGGQRGIINIPSPSILGLTFNTVSSYYYLVVAVVIIGLFFATNIVHSKVGRGLRMILASENAARSSGINVEQYKLNLFVLSAVYAGIAGGLYAHFVNFISPDFFTLRLSIAVFVMVVVGGRENIWGAVLGVLFVTAIPEFLRVSKDYQALTYGVVLGLVLVFAPRGFYGALVKYTDKLPLLWDRIVGRRAGIAINEEGS